MSAIRLLATGLVLLLVVACSGTDPADPDVRFSLEMIPHHRQTLQLAEMAKGRAYSDWIKTASAEIRAQGPADLQMMASWLSTWEIPEPPGGARPIGPGNVTDAEFAKLQGLTGQAFDDTWYGLMSRHLEAGMTIGRIVLAVGDHSPTADLARRLVNDQEEMLAEIGRQLA
ncbi:DUF305 domain-containing protein [Herbidospora sp. NEAU-GS84]|uniref:DUF305 domain-containing protein n=1 Tax=Herbidospora solisilvae TaxID=2696284 RepID=A0A7C9JD12_9ACTN|nr:DUF305 domain-containing protein [Herbidospora solisilvae]NAS21963.1 DUF305 domain-containing protein [Herbidospora solisilvae]